VPCQLQGRAQRRQPSIAVSHRVATVMFQMIEKGTDQRRRDDKDEKISRNLSI
jgi:hypothetical protein